MSDEQKIRDLIETWMTASKSGDLTKVLSLMADDVVFMVPGDKAFGKAEFAATSKGMKNVQFEGKSDVLEIKVIGDWAWSRTHLTVTATPPDGKPMKRAGHTLTIFQKKPDGTWVLARDANLLGPA